MRKRWRVILIVVFSLILCTALAATYIDQFVLPVKFQGWAQTKLSIDPDGQWGVRSRAAATAFQMSRNLQPTGEVDAPTLAALAVRP